MAPRPVNLKNPFPRPPLSEANTTRRRQAATTLGPEGRPPFPLQPFYTTCGQPRPLFIICGVSRHHPPLNPMNLLNPVNPHTAGVSKTLFP